MENESINNKSVDITELAKALCLAQAAMAPAIKDRENPFFKSTYADLASIWEACRDPLTKNGLSVTQLPNTEGATIHLLTMLVHISGQYISSVLSMKAEKETPQAVGSAITYARRYALAAMVGISSEDDDAELTTNHGGKPVVDKPESKEERKKRLLADFAKAEKLLGKEDFMKVIGEQGCSSVEETLVRPGVAEQILKDMGEVYKTKHGK